MAQQLQDSPSLHWKGDFFRVRSPVMEQRPPCSQLPYIRWGKMFLAQNFEPLLVCFRRPKIPHICLLKLWETMQIGTEYVHSGKKKNPIKIRLQQDFRNFSLTRRVVKVDAAICHTPCKVFSLSASRHRGQAQVRMP